jgi:para-aminobenzoate synthetase component 1
MIKIKFAINRMNELGKERTPFLFIIDFLCKMPVILPLNEIDNLEILFCINGITNSANSEFKERASNLELEYKPIDFEHYNRGFKKIQSEINLGNTYLLNLTFPTEIKINWSLNDIFTKSKAKYKLLYNDKFVVFSPETFIKISDNRIYSYPMKGTIDGELPDAEKIILSDEKETAEHYTIVDLIRNDLNMVSNEVRVDRFRYIDKLCTDSGSILQVSSQISGKLNPDWNETIGNIIGKLLPAGSISGAPKERTIEIIQDTEGYTRGYYTGIMGIFDGYSLDSGVMIRFIEKTANGFVFKSGGGITSKSNAKKEYNELQQKIYVPLI